MTATDGAGLAERLMVLCAGLSADERGVLVLVARRLRTGPRSYGRLDLATDGRNWRQEAVEEVADALVYAACGLLRQGGKADEARGPLTAA